MMPAIIITTLIVLIVLVVAGYLHFQKLSSYSVAHIGKEILLKRRLPCRKTITLLPQDIGRIELFTFMASPGSVTFTLSSSYNAALSTRQQFQELKSFSIRNKVHCTIEEMYHGGRFETVYGEK